MGIAELMMAFEEDEEKKKKLLEDCVTNTAKVFALLELARIEFDKGNRETAKKYLDLAANASLVVFAHCGGEFFQFIRNKVSKAVSKEDLDEKIEELVDKFLAEG